jgi:type I restriction enzyme, S subunit
MEKQKNIPQLRFPAFTNEWQLIKFGALTKRFSDLVNVDNERFYKQIGIRSHGKGLFYKDTVTGKSLGNKRVFWVKENAFVVNIVFAWEQAVAKTTKNEIGMIASHRFPMYFPIDNQSNLDYLLHFFLTKKGKYLLGLASPGGAGRNKTLGQKEFENLKLLIPSIAEQTKIASFLTVIDDKITQLKQKKNLLEQYKNGVMQKIFSQEVRLKNYYGKEFPEWDTKTLGELLEYEQPTNYIVKSTEYIDSYKIPVLTAGKTFILGHTNETFGVFENNLPVIIFDDFTTAFKFVDFPFKVKSSAMKILLPQKNANIYFIYEAMQLIDYNVGGHERHWISKYSKLEIPIPCPEEQEKISEFLNTINTKISHCSKQIEKTEQWKKGLLRKIFC